MGASHGNRARSRLLGQSPVANVSRLEEFWSGEIFEASVLSLGKYRIIVSFHSCQDRTYFLSTCAPSFVITWIKIFAPKVAIALNDKLGGS
ncbi:uncharacterized protein VTP21DRAFT_10101 [Calcarisporiella thermophila]|uniref:uncharacterized protein n=1 Tax=Calcarisporiella thermophila TaxID=911321 RepID=UPI003742633C